MIPLALGEESQQLFGLFLLLGSRRHCGRGVGWFPLVVLGFLLFLPVLVIAIVVVVVVMVIAVVSRGHAVAFLAAIPGYPAAHARVAAKGGIRRDALVVAPTAERAAVVTAAVVTAVIATAAKDLVCAPIRVLVKGGFKGRSVNVRFGSFKGRVRILIGKGRVLQRIIEIQGRQVHGRILGVIGKGLPVDVLLLALGDVPVSRVSRIARVVVGSSASHVVVVRGASEALVVFVFDLLSLGMLVASGGVPIVFHSQRSGLVVVRQMVHVRGIGVRGCFLKLGLGFKHLAVVDGAIVLVVHAVAVIARKVGSLHRCYGGRLSRFVVFFVLQTTSWLRGCTASSGESLAPLGGMMTTVDQPWLLPGQVVQDNAVGGDFLGIGCRRRASSVDRWVIWRLFGGGICQQELALLDLLLLDLVLEPHLLELQEPLLLLHLLHLHLHLELLDVVGVVVATNVPTRG
mmetsp:Transcript_18872/g.43524  ORF Transcript_18872/g.43524 Transcript_18872/m.43524 type:complete len:458 (-) Transcript_18872:496-1869(-)